jgi:hypothetical protein
MKPFLLLTTNKEVNFLVSEDEIGIRFKKKIHLL